jgi:hypothetical protein
VKLGYADAGVASERWLELRFGDENFEGVDGFE